MNPLEEWLGSGVASTAVAALIVSITAAALYVVTRRVLLPVLGRLARRSSTRWDDVLADRRLQRWTGLIPPAVVVHLSVRSIPGLNDFWTEALVRVTAVALIGACVLAFAALLMAFNRVYESLPISKNRPIKGYLQVAQIVAYLFADLWALAILVGQSPWFFLSGLGAAAAVLLIIYRDSVLSLIASMQLAQNDMIRVGDWIEMPQFDADGTVVDMALATVKVQNFDKTITTIPTHRLTSESFKNWRGMMEAGCWRIKRAIQLDISSIRFLTEDETALYAAAGHIDPTSSAEGGINHHTNLDAFQGYATSFLHSHPVLAVRSMPVVVRQLAPGPQGLPLEIYAFVRSTQWQRYEEIQGEIIGHLLAAAPGFDLRVFQAPTDTAVRSLRQPDERRVHEHA